MQFGAANQGLVGVERNRRSVAQVRRKARLPLALGVRAKRQGGDDLDPPAVSGQVVQQLRMLLGAESGEMRVDAIQRGHV